MKKATGFLVNEGGKWAITVYDNRVNRYHTIKYTNCNKFKAKWLFKRTMKKQHQLKITSINTINY